MKEETNRKVRPLAMSLLRLIRSSVVVACSALITSEQPILTPDRFLFFTYSLTRELEKKFSDRHVVFVGQRRILGKPSRKNRNQQPRPHSRTLTAVHEAILEDLVYPSEITGKRTRVATDGSRLIKCFLDSKDATSLEYKLDSFSSVYKKLTGRDVTFMFSSDN